MATTATISISSDVIDYFGGISKTMTMTKAGTEIDIAETTGFSRRKPRQLAAVLDQKRLLTGCGRLCWQRLRENSMIKSKRNWNACCWLIGASVSALKISRRRMPLSHFETTKKRARCCDNWKPGCIVPGNKTETMWIWLNC